MKNSNNKHSRVDPTLSRRIFIKKLAYSAPVLMTLGQLSKPISAMADNTGGPEGPPGGFLSTKPAAQTPKKPLQSGMSQRAEERAK
ncbi:MAG: hypothetical protein U9R27_12500 [Campylobacterota bacterium]|nr:hypothetical protein [Campylobacterota bacterium]